MDNLPYDSCLILNHDLLAISIVGNKKFLDRDWFSARLFDAKSTRDQVGVQLQVFDLNFL